MIVGARLIPARIKQARKAMPLEDGRTVTQGSLSEKLGVHWTTISEWERGEHEPETKNLYALAEVTGQPLEFFFRPEADGPPPTSGGATRASQRRDGQRATSGVSGPDPREGEV